MSNVGRMLKKMWGVECSDCMYFEVVPRNDTTKPGTANKQNKLEHIHY